MTLARDRNTGRLGEPRPAGRRTRGSSLSLGAVLLGMLAAACTTASPGPGTSTQPRPIITAAQQPLRDLSVLREPTPTVLDEALRAPYAVPDGGCPAARAQGLQLDAVLGPDVDAPKPKEGRVQAFTAEAVRSAASLPYRGLVRKVSGAAALDEARSAAILAGMVRRGYLKGLLRACAGESTAATVAAGGDPASVRR